jgi:hypothetical protein
MFVKISAGPSVFEKYLQIGPKPSKNPKKSPKNFQTPQEPLSFAPKPSNHSKDPRITPEPPKKIVLPLQVSKAPFYVILVPKFSEFITLSILAFIHNKLVAALYLFVYYMLCVWKFRAKAAVRRFLGASL